MSKLQGVRATKAPLIALNFAHNGLVASTTTGTIPILVDSNGTLADYEYVMPYDGSIVVQTGRLGATPTAGTLTLQPRINGSLTGFTKQVHVNSSDILAFSGKQAARTAKSTFVAGDRVGLSYTANSEWAEDNTIAIVSQVFVLLESVEL